MTRPRFWLLTALALAAAATRLVPHPWNVTPLAAVALLGGAAFGSRLAAFLVPLAALFLSDLALHLTYHPLLQPSWGFYRDQWVVYACSLAAVAIGLLLRGRRTVVTVASASLASSLLFFLVTNFAVWAYGSGVTYPKTAAGLVLCYEMALPFFGNSLAGDFFYSALLFGALAVAEARFPALRLTESEAAPALA